MEVTAEDYVIYTDGACAGNPGPGGWAAVVSCGGETKEIYGREEKTTNQRMELKAAVKGIKATPPGSAVKLYSDSAYLINCFKQGWMKNWLNNGWLNSRGEAVANRDLWEKLLKQSDSRRVEWIKVKGHSNNAGNDRADQLAVLAITETGCGAGAKEELILEMKPADQKKPLESRPAQKARRMGLLTGGGDCPGLNAVIRAVAKSGSYRYGAEVVGFNNGFKGLVENDARLIDDLSVSGILNRGGTILNTSNRDNPFNYSPESTDYRETGQDRSKDALANLERWGVECLVVIGGDGSLLLAHRFSELGVPIIGIPKTIDNDLPATDVTFGFDSAVTTATEAIDKIHTTAESHHRVMVVEVMGRYAGWIALTAGMAGGGDIILIPEIPFSYDSIVEKIAWRRRRGKKFSIVVVAEGAFAKGSEQIYYRSGQVKRLGGIGARVSEEIEKITGMESRATVLGHLQRGGNPTAYDRVLATRFGVEATNLFAAKNYNRMVCLKGNSIQSVPLEEAVEGTKLVDPHGDLVRTAVAVGTSFGSPEADTL